MKINKDSTIKLLDEKASAAVLKRKLSYFSEAAPDKKLIGTISKEIGTLFAKTNGDSEAAEKIAGIISKKYKNAEAKVAIKNILDIKV